MLFVCGVSWFPLVYRPDVPCPAVPAWLSGVAGACVDALSGCGKLPAFAISELGLGLLSSVRGDAGARATSSRSGASSLADCGTSGGLFSSAITSRALHPDRRIALTAYVPDQSAELCLNALTVLML